MRSKSRTADDTTFDRRQSPASKTENTGAESHARRRDDARDTPKRRSTRDGRQPLVVYMPPESIKALKIAAVEYETTASAIVADAVSTWLLARSARKDK